MLSLDSVRGFLELHVSMSFCTAFRLFSRRLCTTCQRLWPHVRLHAPFTLPGTCQPQVDRVAEDARDNLPAACLARIMAAVSSFALANSVPLSYGMLVRSPLAVRSYNKATIAEAHVHSFLFSGASC